MNLNRISIGGGLALVAVALLANAAASLVGTPGRIALADGMKRADKRQQQQPISDVVVPRQDEGGAGAMAMGAGEGCVEVAPQQWFGAIRWLDGCGTGQFFLPGRTALSWADVNGDGVGESLAFGRGAILDGDNPVAPCQVFVDTPLFDGEDLAIERSCVLSTQQIGQWLRQETGATHAHLKMISSTEEFSGWTDMDGDGDLDLLLIVDVWQPEVGLKQVWLENTGFEKQQFAAGDINQDGNVDGVDISILLSDWSY